jgi:hypothetical protein
MEDLPPEIWTPFRQLVWYEKTNAKAKILELIQEYVSTHTDDLAKLNPYAPAPQEEPQKDD